MQISKPEVIYKTINGVISEPYEEVTIDVDKDFVGLISEEMGKRKGIMLNMISERDNQVRLIFKISSQNLLGIRNSLLTKTRGTALMSSYLLGYEAKGNKMEAIRNGALIAVKSGETLTYGLVNAQERGTLFIGTGVNVYEGMVVGIANRDLDIEVNVCKAKKLTNNRSAGEGVSVALVPASPLSLEQALDFINDDELLEVTPTNLRIRKKKLTEAARRVERRRGN
jgi:GTP-binding protein